MKNSTIANVLRAAKLCLRDGSDDIYSVSGKREFICHAVNMTKYSEIDKQNVKNIITSRLGKYNCNFYSQNHDVESWLREVVKVPQKDLTFENIQIFRHRWLDSLVEEFS